MRILGIQIVRLYNNLSIVQLGDLLGVTNGLISQWEQGKKPIPAKRVEQLSKLFDIPEQYFTKVIFDTKNVKIPTIKY